MKEISIRKATSSDLNSIQGLNHELCSKENREFDPTIDPNYPLSQKGEDYLKLRLVSDDSFVLVAEKGTEIIGYLIGALIAPMDYRTITILAEAENMYIKDTFRSQGIGGKLVALFEDWCKERKVQRIRYVASANNVEAIKFYKKHGCKEVDIGLEREL